MTQASLLDKAIDRGLIKDNRKALEIVNAGGLKQAVGQGIVDESILDKLGASRDTGGSDSGGTDPGGTDSGGSDSGGGGSQDEIRVGGLYVNTAGHARTLYSSGAITKAERNEALNFFGADPNSGGQQEEEQEEQESNFPTGPNGTEITSPAQARDMFLSGDLTKPQADSALAHFGRGPDSSLPQGKTLISKLKGNSRCLRVSGVGGRVGEIWIRGPQEALIAERKSENENIFLRLNYPTQPGNYILEIGGDVSDTMTISSEEAGSTKNIKWGWNGTVMEVNWQAGSGTIIQEPQEEEDDKEPSDYPGIVNADNDEGATLAPEIRRKGITPASVGAEVAINGTTIKIVEEGVVEINGDQIEVGPYGGRDVQVTNINTEVSDSQVIVTATVTNNIDASIEANVRWDVDLGVDGELNKSSSATIPIGPNGSAEETKGFSFAIDQEKDVKVCVEAAIAPP